MNTIDYRHICTAGMVCSHDLITAHEALEAGQASMSLRQVLMRHLILELSNIEDLAVMSNLIHKDHQDLRELYSPIKKELKFFKYLRNIYVGHITKDLTDKTFEWQPFTNALLGNSTQKDQLIVSLFTFETAINTYADSENGHKIFNSDTDLNYPPDQTRFLNLLGETTIKSLDYASQLITITRSYIDVPDVDKDMINLAITASQTDFKYLAKKNVNNNRR